MSGYPTCRRHPRTLGEAFADARAAWGDEIVMSRWSPSFDGDFVDTYDTTTAQPEAASACSEFGHEEKQQAKAQTVTTWQRFVRAVRAWWVNLTYKP